MTYTRKEETGKGFGITVIKIVEGAGYEGGG